MLTTEQLRDTAMWDGCEASILEAFKTVPTSALKNAGAAWKEYDDGKSLLACVGVGYVLHLRKQAEGIAE